MPKSKVITSHTSGKRDSWWYLVQDPNRALFVEHENDDEPEQGRTRWTLNEALEKGIASPDLQRLVDRMFKDDDAQWS